MRQETHTLLGKKHEPGARVSSLIKLLVALKKETPVQTFSCKFAKFLRTPYKEHLRTTAFG